jgi:hypothetical protein
MEGDMLRAFIGFVTLVGAALQIPHPGFAAESQGQRYSIKAQWVCRPRVFIGWDVFHDGSASPIKDSSFGPEPITIAVKEESASYEPPSLVSHEYSFSDNTYVTVNGTKLFDVSEAAPISISAIRLGYEDKERQKINMMSSVIFYPEPTRIIIRQDNDAWKFIISRTSITTNNQARRLNILPHDPRISFRAESELLGISGDCVLDQYR